MSQKSELEKRAKELGLTVVRRDGKDAEPTIEDFQHAIGVAEGSLLPDEAPASEGAKRFRVIGAQEVLGHAPGTEFTSDELEPWQEKVLVEGGALEIVDGEGS